MSHRDADTSPEETSNSLLTNTSGCCFCFPCFYSRRSSSVGLTWWERIHGNDHPWCARGITAFKKIREWSELVAGPKWKTFIRRFNRNSRGSGSGHNRHGRKFQYDPLSYALNFDEGPGGQNGNFDDENDDYGGFRDFSTRYASASGRPLAMEAARMNNTNKEEAVIA